MVVWDYVPILIFIVLALCIGGIPLLLSALVSPKKPNPVKLSPFECGFPAAEDARLPFDIRFYLVAILFILFDLETAFLFPWGVALRKIGIIGLVTMGIFIALLIVGFLYEWYKGALEWE